MNNPFLPLDQHITGDIFTGTAAMDVLTDLCDRFGSRFGGTPGERQAAEYIKEKLEEYGLKDVHLEPFEYLGWRRGEARLEILEPVQALDPVHATLPCISLPHSPAAHLEGEIIDLGDGAPDDFERRAAEIRGKIVMVTSEINPKNTKRWVHRSEKFGRSVLAGATGFIFVNHYPAYGPATGGIGYRNQAALIPGISISKEGGAYLQRLAKRAGRVTIRLVTSDSLAPMTSWNIVGDLPGAEYPSEVVMLGSHYDGHDISQGAVDPASGVAAVLEAARVLAKYAQPLPRTLRFALWGVEEIGLLGSRAYVAAHAVDLKNIRFYLNMDAAGGVDPLDIMLHEWPELQATFEGYRDQMALDFTVGQSFHAASDHFPFLQAGVTTGGIESVRKGRTGRGYGHTRHDTVDKVSQENLRGAACLAARLALRVASEADWPASPRDAAAVGKLLEQPGQKDIQEYRARLDALYDRLKNEA
jgi:Zn-dependent M28 family amino/carboxypeptidase